MTIPQLDVDTPSPRRQLILFHRFPSHGGDSWMQVLGLHRQCLGIGFNMLLTLTYLLELSDKLLVGC